MTRGIGGRARYNQLRADFLCLRFQFIIINAVRDGVNAVGDEVIVQSGEVDGASVRQVPAVGKAHAHDRVACVQERDIYGGVRLRAGVGLYIGIRGAEQSLGTLNCKVFHNVHAAAASVVPVCGVPLCILVGEDTAGGGKYCFRNDILRCDKFKSVLLARKLRPDGSGDFRIVRRQAPVGAADPFIHDHDTTSFQIFVLFRLRQRDGRYTILLYGKRLKKASRLFHKEANTRKFFVYIIDNGRHLCYNTVKSGSMPTSRKDVRVGTWTDLGRKEGVANGNCNNRT